MKLCPLFRLTAEPPPPASSDKPRLTVWFCTLFIPCVMAAGGLVGCQSPPRPESRLGALPFFGAFTLYDTVDPAKPGGHSYGTPRFDETSRGILYTCKAGFVDFAHVRTIGDWSWYSAVKVRQALREGRPRVTIRGMDETRYHVRFQYPAFWDELGPVLEETLIDKLSIGIGLKLAQYMLTWHETITWHGYKSAGFISEFRSAFTWDDMSSHVVGLRVAAEALSANQRTLDEVQVYNQAMTRALASAMDRLHAVNPKQTRQAIEAVKGKWWAEGQPLKRQVEAALADREFHPWLVSGLPFCPDQPGKPIHLSRINPMLGAENSMFYEVWLNSDIWEMGEIRRVLGIEESHRQMIRPRTDFPVLLKDIRRKVADREGEAALLP